MDVPYWIPKPCEHGHVFMWTSSSTVDINPPRGVGCQCGELVADGTGGTISRVDYLKENGKT